MRTERLLAIVVIVVLVGVLPAFGSGFGEWNTNIVVSPVGETISFAGSQSTLKGSYFTGEVAEMSSSALSSLFITDRRLSDTGMGMQAFCNLPMSAGDPKATVRASTYLKEEIVIDWPIGTYTVLSDTVFSISNASLTRAWLDCVVNAYGLKLDAAFLLLSSGPGCAFGTDLSLQGMTVSGMTITINTTFGIGADLKEIPTAPAADPCPCYEGTEISIDGLSLGCLHYGALISFSRSGFELAQFEFGLDPLEGWSLPVSFDFTLTFTTQTKSLVVVVPTLYVGGECISVYTALDVEGNGTGGALSFGGLSVAGLSIKGMSLGSVKLSGILAIDSVLYKTGKDDDITMRATDYVIPCDCYTSQAPTKYDLIVSLQYSDGTLDAAGDLYFNPSGGSLFNLGLFTGQVSYILNSEVTLAMGAAIDPTAGLQRLTLDLSVSLYR